MKAWYQMLTEEVLKQLDTRQSGLPGRIAEERLKETGENVLEEGKRKQAWQVFLEQFQDLLVIILIVAAVISMVSDNVESTVVILR